MSPRPRVIDVAPIPTDARSLLASIETFCARVPQDAAALCDLLCAITLECAAIGEAPSQISVRFSDDGPDGEGPYTFDVGLSPRGTNDPPAGWDRSEAEVLRAGRRRR